MDEISKHHKVRFKFASGEEFEAEGSLDFVEQQRDFFLALIKKKPLSSSLSNQAPHALIAPISTRFSNPAREDSSVTGTLTPRLYATAPGQYAQDTTSTMAPSIPQDFSNTNTFSSVRLWEQLLAQEGDTLYLRRKFHLPADEAALLLLAGGKELLHKAGCSALWLSRALTRSGFETGRLDRLLATPIKLNFLLCEGSKRSRLYTLTPQGLAHAVVVAEKKAQSL